MTQQTSAVSESRSTTAANNINQSSSEARHNWQAEEVKALFDMPFNDLMFKAQVIHRANFNPNEVLYYQLKLAHALKIVNTARKAHAIKLTSIKNV